MIAAADIRRICMLDLISVNGMRESDKYTTEHGVSGRELMKRAGNAIFEAAAWVPPVAVVCGKGNNAGDGFVLAALLRRNGITCTIVLRERVFSGDGAFYYSECEAMRIPTVMWRDTETLRGYGSVADCIFGTGFRGEPDEESKRMIRMINESGAYTVSADINSGLNGDNGLADCAVRSDLTVSVGCLKTGHFLNMAKDMIREVRNADIGIRPVGITYGLAEAKDLKALFAKRPEFCNKGTWGTAVLIGGSVRFSGAVRLTNMAACAARCGSGVIRIGAPDCICNAVMPRILESTLFPLGSADGGILFSAEEFSGLILGARSAAFGMGIGNTAETAKALLWLLDHFSGTLVIDADGLNALHAIPDGCLRDRRFPTILTPHPGEFSRMTGLTVREILEDPIRTAEQYARKNSVILLLKGTASIVTDGERTVITDRGCAGMATAGSGDVLSGMIASLSSWMKDPLEAAMAAAWLNGRAGEIAQERYGDIAMIAGDTASCIPDALAEVRLAEN